MARGANVRSLDAVRTAKAIVSEYRHTAMMGISEAMAEVDRTAWYFQSELPSRWKAELQRRQRALQNAISEYHRAELQNAGSQGGMVSLREQRALVEKCKRAVTEAEEKLRRTKHWATMLQREAMLFKGQCQTLSRYPEGDMERAEAELELTTRRLEEYLSEQVGSGGSSRARRPAASGSAGDDATDDDATPEESS